MSCRICASPTEQILDLGESPPANGLKRSATEPEASYPLVLEWCRSCSNVQLRDTLSADALYRHYRYVTPQSAMLESHYEYLLGYLKSNRYLPPRAFVVEAGSNAGHFLRHIRPQVGAVLGVDPAREISEMANAAGIPTINDYFSVEVARAIRNERGNADLVVARHCLAHNESPHEMIRAAKQLMTDDSFFVIENAYVLNTLENGEFDQIYHEHMFYYSIASMKFLLAIHGLRLVDVTMSLVHGGSVIFVASHGSEGADGDAVRRYEARERLFLTETAFAQFAARAEETRQALGTLIAELRDQGRTIYTYGATAKGTTLLNYVRLTSEQIEYCVDSTPLKQGLFIPKSNIQIIPEEEAAQHPPDYYLLTAWNYQDEIISKVRQAGNYMSKFIVPIPFVRVV